ncbi:MAG TPA: sulfotransferase [Xanthobacteraceae bacterium]|nr:sulfotransferase [Xanthobacteraceae bacterium]
MIEGGGENLAFLLSTPRAGSTLVSAILSMHPQVCSPNEPWFLLGLASLYEGGNITRARYEHGGVELALRELLSESEFRQAARAFAVSAYNQVLAREGRRIFVDKTPRYYHITDFIERLFPSAKKIWLKRNPLDVVVSYRTSFNVSVQQMFDPEFGPVALDLPLGLPRLEAFFRGQPSTFELFYEDLAAQPADTVARLCNFLNISYADRMEIYGNDPQALARRKRLSMGDTKLFASSAPHNASVGQWEKSLTNEEIQTVLHNLGRRIFERMGYLDTIELLTRRGFAFPSEAEVAVRRRVFVDAAKSLTWTSRRDLRLREMTAEVSAMLNLTSWHRAARRLIRFRKRA